MKNKIKDPFLDYNVLIGAINAYLDLRYSENTSDNIEETHEITIKCVNAFAKIFEECLSFGKFKDTWEYDKFYQNIYGPELIIEALKTKCGYRL